jgi:hypothetical protein
VQRQVFEIKLLFGCGIGHSGFGYNSPGFLPSRPWCR